MYRVKYFDELPNNKSQRKLIFTVYSTIPFPSQPFLMPLSKKVLHASYLDKQKQDSFFPGWNRRWFVLDPESISYFKDHAAFLQRSPSGCFLLTTVLSVLPAFGSDLDFLLTTGIRTYRLRAESLADRDNWVLFINNVKEYGTIHGTEGIAPTKRLSNSVNLQIAASRQMSDPYGVNSPPPTDAFNQFFPSKRDTLISFVPNHANNKSVAELHGKNGATRRAVEALQTNSEFICADDIENRNSGAGNRNSMENKIPIPEARLATKSIDTCEPEKKTIDMTSWDDEEAETLIRSQEPHLNIASETARFAKPTRGNSNIVVADSNWFEEDFDA